MSFTSRNTVDKFRNMACYNFSDSNFKKIKEAQLNSSALPSKKDSNKPNYLAEPPADHDEILK